MDPLALALEDTLGPALVLDAELRIVAWTPQANDIAGPLRSGLLAPAVLCGESEKRPVAEALAAGRAVSAEVVRVTPEGTSTLQVRASPLVRDGERRGWLLVLEETADEDAHDAPMTRWGMTTRAPVMKKLFRDIERIARRDTTVLVRGPSGAGKELVAKAIHEASRRRDGTFRAINCAALPPQLLESELFGHVRGSFTGAVRDAEGHFRLAEGGTLFLDEIAEMPLELQAKLLRVLQEKKVIPVGGREPVPVDVRIVSATNVSLRQAVREGLFREDLMYRLRVIPLYLPPLHSRDGDVQLLARRFLDRLADDERRVETLSHGALRLLEHYDWPGNVRELQNVMEYAFAMGDGAVLTEADLPPELRGAEPDAVQVNAPPRSGEGSSEEELVLRALERAGGHRGRAAAMLGVSRSTLWRRMKALGVLDDE